MRDLTITRAAVTTLLLAGLTAANTTNIAAGPVKIVAVSPASASIEVAKTVQLTAVDANGAIVGAQWTSSAPAVATVSASGLVTGVSAGNATIMAKSGRWKATASVTVTAPPAPPPPPPPPPPAIDPSWVVIYPGDTIQTSVNLYPTGTTFYLKAGTYRQQVVRPKTDNRFIGEPGAVLDGENVAPYAFLATTSLPQRVTISKLVIRNYASAASQGAIQGDNGTGWVIEDSQIHNNKVIGVRIGKAWQVRRNKVYRNGVIGISGYKANGSIIESNEVYENNYLQAPEQPILSEASGMKFGETANVVIRSNHVHHNFAKGIWVDHSLPTSLIERNTVTDNVHQGIFFESSYTATIRYNTVERNALSAATWPRAGITVTNSPNVEIHNNTVRDNANGITAMNSANTALSAPLGPLRIENLYVHDNTVRMATGKTGLGQNTGEMQVYTTWNNRFEHNTYYLGTSSTYFTWNSQNLNESQWRGYGLDVIGTFIRY